MALQVSRLTAADVATAQQSGVDIAGWFDVNWRSAGDSSITTPPVTYVRDALSSPELAVAVCFDTATSKYVGLAIVQTTDVRVLWQVCNSDGANAAQKAARFVSISAAMLAAMQTRATQLGITNPWGRANPWGTPENATVRNAMLNSGRYQTVVMPTGDAGVTIEFMG